MTATAIRPGDPALLEGLRRLTEGVTAPYLEHHAVLPLRREGEGVLVGTCRSVADEQVVDDFTRLFGGEVQLLRLPEGELRAAIRRLYSPEAQTAEGVVQGLASESVGGAVGEIPLDDLMSLANEAPVVRLVNLLLLEALEARASDVHLEAHARGLQVRYRVYGVLQDAPSPPGHSMPAVVSRLKIMAELDVAERRIPQDGRLRLRLQDRQVDVRVSTVPTLHGESVVLRLLDKERGRITLEEIGMGPDTLNAFVASVRRPNGIVLVTGPTGSGKTTTLYAAMDRIRTGKEKILTVEDPVEYELPGVAQVPVNEKVGVTFATALRALLRQDPDVILIGEIRDQETAEIATHASLTGHLVLSTLHTNDAPSALTRLRDLGVAPYLIASTVEAVLAQRLVRRVCAQCAVEATPERSELMALGPAAEGLERVKVGKGCPACRGSGYRGRLGVYELLLMNDGLRDGVLKERSAGELRRAAAEGGMRGLMDDGVRLIRAGLTTPSEVARVAVG